jgi:hypothetical protein
MVAESIETAEEMDRSESILRVGNRFGIFWGVARPWSGFDVRMVSRVSGGLETKKGVYKTRLILKTRVHFFFIDNDNEKWMES